MDKKIVYCLDCEDDFRQKLGQHGFEIINGRLGYNRKDNRFLSLNDPPNECDVMVFNLTDPACFDMNYWGPEGGNNNFKCEIVKEYDKSTYAYGATLADGKRYPRFPLIKESQIDKDSSTFNYNHLRKAIFEGGIDCIYYLNPVFMFHSLFAIPSWLGFSLEINITKVKKFYVSEKVKESYDQFDEMDSGDLEFCKPIEYKLTDLRRYSNLEEHKFEKLNLLTNNINDCLGAIIKLGKGSIYCLPSFKNPLKGTIKLIEEIMPKYKEACLDKSTTKKLQFVVKNPIELKKDVPYELLPLNMFINAKDYIIKIVAQINGCYANEYFDACATMMRRFIETLIIEIYENKKRIKDIKNNGEIIGLEKLIIKLENESTFHISREVIKTLGKIKTMGDTGSHNRKVNLTKEMIDDVKTKFGIAVSELNSNIKYS